MNVSYLRGAFTHATLCLSAGWLPLAQADQQESLFVQVELVYSASSLRTHLHSVASSGHTGCQISKFNGGFSLVASVELNGGERVTLGTWLLSALEPG